MKLAFAMAAVTAMVACSDRKSAAPKPTPASAATAVPTRPPPKPSTAEITQVAVGRSHTCTLHADASVACWGSNEQGQLGIPDLDRSLYPAAVPAAAGAVEITAVGNTTCIRRADHTVACWGHIGEQSETATPGQITDGIAQLSGRCFRRIDGGVECLEANAQVVRLDGVADAIWVASYEEHGCAVKRDGKVTCWLPSVALGKVVRDFLELATVSDAAQVAVDSVGNVCVLSKRGTVQCFAMADAKTVLPVAARTAVGGTGLVGGLSDICVRTATDIACWDENSKQRELHVPPETPLALGIHSCFAKPGRDLRCWGNMVEGELGNGWWQRRPVPARIPQITDAVELGGPVNRGGACVRHADGGVSCWGNIGGATVSAVPARLAIKNARAFAGSDLVRVIDTANRVHEAIYDSYYPDNDQPTFRIRAKDVASANDYCFVSTAGRMRCWKSYLEVDPKDPRYSLAPRNEDAVAVASYSEQGSNCVRHRDNRVSCFRQGSDFEEPKVFADAIAIAVTEYAQCAIRADHTLWCWGSTTSPIFAPRPEPEDVPPTQVPIRDVIAISLARDAICAVRSTGTVACWGANDQGQLGDGTFMPRDRPADVVGISDAIDVKVGLGFTCALHRDGRVSCWGATDRGQIGTFATSNVIDPVRVVWP